MARRRTSRHRPAEPAGPAALPEGWVGPFQAGVPDPTATRIGVLDGPAPAWVDPRGLVVAAGVAVDWWIGSESRWHLPAREVGVRQNLVGGAPVVETRVRVPSGDAVSCVYGTRTPTGAAVVIEITNDSPVPLAVALVVRPHGLSGVVPIGEVALDGVEVRADGRLVLVAERPPHHAVLGDASGDVAAVVTANGAGPLATARRSCGSGLAQAALVFALPHRTSVRALIPLSGAPGPVPDAATVASGWASQRDRGARVVLPAAGRLADALGAARAHLLLGATDRAAPVPPEQVEAVVVALAEWGYAEEAAAVLDAARPASSGPGVAAGGGWVRALGRHLDLGGAVPGAADDVVEAVASVLGSALQGVAGREADAGGDLLAVLDAGAGVLDRLGETRAAADARRALGRLVAAGALPRSPATSGRATTGVDVLSRWLEHASPTWTWASEPDGAGTRHGPHDLGATATFASLARRVLVDEAPGTVVLAPLVPAAWLGQGWEVHDVPTSGGKVGYAVRWHGERPALLWELEPVGGAPVPSVRAPGLDPTWSSGEARGEALLAPPGAGAGTQVGGVRS